MNRSALITMAVCLGGGLWTAPAAAESVRLKTGEILIGKVKAASFQEVRMHTIFPKDGELTLPASKLDPASHYVVLAVRLDLKDAQLRFRLAEFCIQRGLFAYAIAESERAAKLDPKLALRSKALRKKATDSIAEHLLEEAKTHIAIEQDGRARLFLTSILERYPTSRSAAEARRLLRTLKRTRKPKQAEPLIVRKRAKDALRKKLARAKKLLDKADKRTGALKRHFTSSRGDERLLRWAVSRYGKAHRLLREATRRSTDDNTLNRELKALAVLVRTRLTRSFLELGELYLSRGAIRLAERNCSQACLLAPSDRSLHTLHKRILDARIALRFGGYN